MANPTNFGFRRAVIATACAALLTSLSLVSACSSPDERAQAYYQKGLALLEAGDHVKAGLEFRNALQINSKMAPAWYGLAQVAERQQNWEKVYGALNNAIDADPRYLEALLKRGALILAAGEVDRALSESESMLAAFPERPEVRAYRAEVLYRRGDRDGALVEAGLALEKAPNNVNALVVLARERIAAGDTSKAIEFIDRGLAADQRNMGLRQLRIQALDAAGRAADVEAEFRQLIALFPESTAIRKSLAAYYLEHGRPNDAEEEYRAIVAANPASAEAKLDVVRFLNTVKGQDAAEAELKALVAAEPANPELRLLLAQWYVSTGQVGAAEDVLQSVIAQQGTEASGVLARVRLAAIKVGAGEKAAGEQLISEALAVEPRNAQALMIRASLATERRAFNDAVADLHTVLRDDPNSAQVLLMLARVHELAGAMELAEDNYSRAYQAGKGGAEAGMEHGRFLVRRGKIDRAEQVFRAVLQASPDNVSAMTALASVLVAGGQGVEAEKVLRDIDSGRVAVPVSEQLLGAALAAQGRDEESLQAFVRAQQAAPDATQPMVALVNAYERTGKHGEAEQFLLSALRTDPGNTAARLLLGQFYVARGKPDAAEDALREIITRTPSEITGYRALAGLYAAQGRGPEALAMVEQGLAQQAGDSALRLTRAIIYQRQGNVEGAIAEYEAMLRDEPDAIVPANNLAALLSDHRTDAASLKRASELAKRLETSEAPAFLDTLGWVRYRVGDVEGAVAILKKVVDKAPNVAVFRYHFGMALLAQQDKAAAKRELQKALELSEKRPLPEDKAIREALAAL